MTERQVSQHNSPGNPEYRDSDIDLEDDGRDVRQSRQDLGMPHSQSQSNAGSNDEVKDLLQLMVRQQQIQSKKLDVLQGQIDSASSKVHQVALKMHGEEKRVFRKKGIEFQYRHNASVVSNYDEIGMAAAAKKYDVIPQLVDQGKSFVLQRQRTLRFADEKGWVFVEVYEADDIAIDSEDDRKIKKCEKRAKELTDQRFKKKQKFNNSR